jgi:hypothetical protein
MSNRTVYRYPESFKRRVVDALATDATATITQTQTRRAVVACIGEKMRIEAKTSADVVGLTIKRNQKHDGQEAYVDIEIGVKYDEAEKTFGEDFQILAFSSMRQVPVGEEGTEKIIHLQDLIKPGERVVFEKHVIEINGTKLKEQPKLLHIKTVDGDAKAIAKLRIPIDVDSTLVAELTQQVGDVVEVQFNPEQQLLDLDLAREAS